MKHHLNKKFYKESWFFETVMEHIGVSITVTDLDEKIIFVNHAAEELFGYPREELIGQNPVLTNAEPEKDKIQSDIYTTVMDGKVWHNRIKNQRKNGEIFLLDLTVATLKNEYGEIVALVGFQKDASEIEQSELNLKEVAAELKQSNEELEQFAYVASHDLQEPLRVVSSYCQLLTIKRKEHAGCSINDPEIDKYFSYIIDATSRMKKLIKELLDFSRVGRKDRPFEKIDLKELLDEICFDFELSIQETDAHIVIEDNLPVICGIRFRIKQLLSNLISNALKFRSQEPPVIRIGCCPEENYWLFYVSDNGIGIKPQYFDRIFGIFKRLYSREEYPGTGIGLALCKRIVETHGGKIWADSGVVKGTCMYFTISKSVDLNNWQLAC